MNKYVMHPYMDSVLAGKVKKGLSEVVAMIDDGTAEDIVDSQARQKARRLEGQSEKASRDAEKFVKKKKDKRDKKLKKDKKKKRTHEERAEK